MNVIKKLNDKIAPYLTHLFNNMIRTSIYPQRLKVTKILPILKPQKNKYNINGYRPVNICNPIDKLFQEHVKNYLTQFFEENGKILSNNHGVRKKS